MKNIEKVKKILCKRFPKEKKAILKGDEYFVCNRFLQNNENRSQIAGLLGFAPKKCSICAKQTENEECPFWKLPNNNCRNGILEWLLKDETN